MRWARPGAGKRGGLPPFDYWAAAETAFYLLYAVFKNSRPT